MDQKSYKFKSIIVYSYKLKEVLGKLYLNKIC